MSSVQCLRLRQLKPVTTARLISATALTGRATVCIQVMSRGVGMVLPFGGGQSVTPIQKPSTLPKNMLNSTELDQRRADFMDMLYETKGRQGNLYTGLWAEFQQHLANKFRDLDYEVMRNDIIRGVSGIDNDVAKRNADVAITVMTKHLMEDWGEQ